MSASKMPVSVLLPVYNGGRFLHSAIQSILEQTYTDFELLIVDDGSTDDTSATVRSFKDPRIRYHYISHRGLGQSLNAGLALASNDIIARMDADDIALPGRLEKQLRAYSENPVNTIVGSWYILFSESGIRGIVQTNTSHPDIVKRLSLHNELVHSGVVFHRNIIQSSGGYQSEPFEDFEMWLRIKDKIRFVNLPEPLTLVRQQEASLSRGDYKNKYAMIHRLLKKYAASEEVLMRDFEFATRDDARVQLGWQEYFYGDRGKAQRLWLPLLRNFNVSARVVIAFLACYLPERQFIAFKEARWRFRLELVNFRNKREVQKMYRLLKHFEAI